MFISRIDLPVYFMQWFPVGKSLKPIWTDPEDMRRYPSPEDAAEDMLKLTEQGYAVVLEDA